MTLNFSLCYWGLRLGSCLYPLVISHWSYSGSTSTGFMRVCSLSLVVKKVWMIEKVESIREIKDKGSHWKGDSNSSSCRDLKWRKEHTGNDCQEAAIGEEGLKVPPQNQDQRRSQQSHMGLHDRYGEVGKSSGVANRWRDRVRWWCRGRCRQGDRVILEWWRWMLRGGKEER